MHKNVATFIGCDGAYADSKIVLFGAPYDCTTSYRPGTRFAPNAMRNESFGLETYSPYQDKDLLDAQVFDSGDLELPFGDPAPALDMITDRTRQIVADGKLPCMIGGEHLVTLGAVRLLAEQHKDLCIVHFDAHADLRDDYLGSTLSHATVMRRCYDLVGNGRIHQFGIRSGDREEFAFAKDHVNMTKFTLDNVEQLTDLLGDRPVYFTLDLDVLDPSCFPGTGTPEAGGVGFLQLIKAFETIGRLNIVGLDINELCPVYDQSGMSTALACKVLRELLLSVG